MQVPPPPSLAGALRGKGADGGRGSVERAGHDSGMHAIDFCITQLKAQGPSRTCNESKEEEEKRMGEREEDLKTKAPKVTVAGAEFEVGSPPPLRVHLRRTSTLKSSCATTCITSAMW